MPLPKFQTIWLRTYSLKAVPSHTKPTLFFLICISSIIYCNKLQPRGKKVPIIPFIDTICVRLSRGTRRFRGNFIFQLQTFASFACQSMNHGIVGKSNEQNAINFEINECKSEVQTKRDV